MEVYCIVRKVTAALRVIVLIKYLKNLSNNFLKISQPLLRKSVNVKFELTFNVNGAVNGAEEKKFFSIKKKKKKMRRVGRSPTGNCSQNLCKQPFNSQRQIYFWNIGFKTYLYVLHSSLNEDGWSGAESKYISFKISPI